MLKTTCSIWLKELRYVLTDEGMLLFLLLLPVAYPIAYSWIYNNEVVREVPVAVVDRSGSHTSREFARLYDASPGVRVAWRANDMTEAERMVAAGEAYGVVYFPADFERRVLRGERATVGIYCDMQLMLAYKNIYQTATAVSQKMGAEIQTRRLGNTTAREDDIAATPMPTDDVALFNTTLGYGNFIIPGVLMLILQQVLLLSIGLTAGTLRERCGRLVLRHPLYRRTVPVVLGKTMAYALLYAVLAAWVLLAVPRIFSFTSLVHGLDLTLFVLPYILACIFFAMTAMSIVRRREDVLLLVVFMSVPLLFMAGVSWPLSNIPKVWQWVAMVFPSTFGIRGFIAMNTMGARLPDIMPQVTGLWVQTAVYLTTTLLIYRRELRK